MSNIIKLPTPAPGFYRVRRSGTIWAVELVTPRERLPFATVLATSSDRQAATQYAKEIGIKMKRPVRLPRGWA